MLAARRSKQIAQWNSPVSIAAPLIAYYPMEPDMAQLDASPDLGPLAMDGRLVDGALYDGNGHRDNALRLDGRRARVVVTGAGAVTHQTGNLTVTAWVARVEMPRKDTVGYIASAQGLHGGQPSPGLYASHRTAGGVLRGMTARGSRCGRMHRSRPGNGSMSRLRTARAERWTGI